jgi:hypothetical protein
MATTNSELPTLSVDLVRAARRSEDLSREHDLCELADALDRYVKWLRLIARNPDVPIAPSRDIDMMWHLHMLHPRAYAADCDRILGFLLDHNGGFGAELDEMPVLQRVFDATAALWESEYGEPYIGGAGNGMTKCTRNCVSRCQRACKTVEAGREPGGIRPS